MSSVFMASGRGLQVLRKCQCPEHLICRMFDTPAGYATEVGPSGGVVQYCSTWHHDSVQVRRFSGPLCARDMSFLYIDASTNRRPSAYACIHVCIEEAIVIIIIMCLLQL